MKKLFSILALIVITTALVLSPITMVSAETTIPPVSDEFVSDSIAYNYMVDLVTTFPNRTAGGNEDVANYLLAQFVAMGYGDLTANPDGLKDNLVRIENFNYADPLDNNASKSGYNVIATIKSKVETSEKIIISASYDNLTDLKLANGESVGGDGTMINGTGVGVLLAVAESIIENDYPFNVEIILFDANEVGLKGSSQYLNKYDDEALEEILLAIHYYGIIGDYTYIYADEVEREHLDYYETMSNDANYGFKKVPNNKKIIPLSVVQPTGLNYTHRALGNDNAGFLGKDVPILTFIGGNYEAGLFSGFVENADMLDMGYTANDTLENYNKHYGEQGIIVLDNIVELTINSIADTNFSKVMKSSKANATNYDFWFSGGMTFILFGLGVLVIVAGVFYSKKLKKESEKYIKEHPEKIPANPFMGMGNAKDNGVGGNMNKPKSLDPFDLDDKTTESKSTNNKDNDPFNL